MIEANSLTKNELNVIKEIKEMADGENLVYKTNGNT